jgi:hypothetical protein
LLPKASWEFASGGRSLKNGFGPEYMGGERGESSSVDLCKRGDTPPAGVRFFGWVNKSNTVHQISVTA